MEYFSVMVLKFKKTSYQNDWQIAVGTLNQIFWHYCLEFKYFASKWNFLFLSIVLCIWHSRWLVRDELWFILFKRGCYFVSPKIIRHLLVVLSDALKAVGVEVDRKSIKMDNDSIKEIGTYGATANLHKEVKQAFNFEVVGE